MSFDVEAFDKCQVSNKPQLRETNSKSEESGQKAKSLEESTDEGSGFEDTPIINALTELA